MASKVRLFVEHPLGEGQSVPLSQEQAHYLFNVMRLPVGAVLLVFNGENGEWDAEVIAAGKRRGELVCRVQTRPLVLPPDVWLVFAPIKKQRTDFIVEKAVELGVRRILPVQTEFTNERMRHDKMLAHAREAAEQCGATYVPEVAALAKLGDVIAGWSEDRSLMFCDEGMTDRASALTDRLAPPSAILIGPEGGFSEKEREMLRGLPFTEAISLGPRILRADTAAVAALTLWQAQHGDW